METSSSDSHANSSSSSNSMPSSPRDSSSVPSRRYGIQFPPPLRFFHSPVSSLLEYSGLLRLRPDHSEAEPLIGENNNNNSTGANTSSNAAVSASRGSSSHNSSSNNGSSNGEVSIRIIGAGEGDRLGSDGEDDEEEAMGSMDEAGQERRLGTTSVSLDSSEESVGGGSNSNGRGESSYQRYGIQQFARWIEQILPFSLLLLVVFIRQHLQGFFVTIWISAFMFKSNDILRKQTALKGERKIFVLVSYFVVFMLHVFGIYWWYRNDDLYYPLFMVPPKSIPPFWHAIFIILVNDTMVRQVAMSLKLLLLMYYKNGRGHNFRRQGQMLTLVEYTLLLYRALLPTPVWYRFFLNKDYGSLFSSLTTGLYLTFKLTSIVEKVQSFLAALKALSRREIHYGSYATSEQVSSNLLIFKLYWCWATYIRMTQGKITLSLQAWNNWGEKKRDHFAPFLNLILWLASVVPSLQDTNWGSIICSESRVLMTLVPWKYVFRYSLRRSVNVNERKLQSLHKNHIWVLGVFWLFTL